MLPSIDRIRKRSGFLTVASKGHKVVASTLVLQAYKPPQQAQQAMRVGFTVTKKNGNAVVRNRIRRRLKAAAEDILPVQGKPGWDYVVIGRYTALQAPFDVITRDLRYAVRKVTRKEEEKR